MPLGLYSTHVAQKTGKRDYVPLALVPFFFGVQQFVEGLEWTAIDNGGVEPLGTLAGGIGIPLFRLLLLDDLDSVECLVD